MVLNMHCPDKRCTLIFLKGKKRRRGKKKKKGKEKDWILLFSCNSVILGVKAILETC